MNLTQQKTTVTRSVSFIEDLERHYPHIKEEFLRVVSEDLCVQWPERFLYNEGWNVFGLRFQYQDLPEAHALCPYISRLVKKYDRMIETAGFSILSPGTVIRPHVGYSHEVLRCHLGIQVPPGDCCLRVGAATWKWKEGRAFIFDDTIEHEAWNRTDQKRIVMLLDLKKDCLLFN